MAALGTMTAYEHFKEGERLLALSQATTYTPIINGALRADLINQANAHFLASQIALTADLKMVGADQRRTWTSA